MVERIAAEGREEDEDDRNTEEKVTDNVVMSRKEKRKAAKKQKRKQVRREAALKEREVEEARINDPEEQMRVRLMEEEEARRVERERKEFEEKERVWIEAMEKKKAEEEEEQRKAMEELEKDKVENHNEFDEDGEWKYIDEGPAEIIWQGNEIIVKKKRVRVAKKDVEKQNMKEDTDRPTSNPLPPQSEAFADYKDASIVSAQQAFENVAQQIPNFGTEQDKAHCPFHFKTGACRFGQSCSRVHFYPDKSCTLLIKNMYNGPGLAWEQDEGLEHTDEEVEHCYEEFYEDVHTEFLKFGEIVNFKVCKNGSSHLRGNVYVHYKSLDSAVLAYHSINGRYFAGKQISCEFAGVTRWKVAICGEYMKSRMKTCSRGTACNFIHCFCNPGGDYEWANWDKPAPRYWVRKMAVLFGYSDEYAYDKEMEQKRLGQQRKSCRAKTADADSYHSRRSKSRDMDCLISVNGRSLCDENHFRNSKERSRSDGRDLTCPDGANLGYYNHDKNTTLNNGSDRVRFNTDVNRVGQHNYTRKSSKQRHEASALPDEYGNYRNDNYECDSDIDLLDKDKSIGKYHDMSYSSRCRKDRVEYPDILCKNKTRTNETYSCGDFSDRERVRDRQSGSRRKHSKHQNGTLEILEDHWVDKNKTRNTDSEGSDRDGNRCHGQPSSRYKEVGYYFDSEKRDHYNTSDIHCSNWENDGEKLHNCRRDSSRQQIELSDRSQSKNRMNDGDFSEDLSDGEKGRHHSCKRKRESERVSHCDKKLDKLKDKQIAEEKIPKHGHSSRRDSMRRKREDEYGSDSRFNPDENIDDHWEPGSSFPSKHRKYRTKHARDDYCEAESPGRYDGRNESRDIDSEYCTDEFVYEQSHGGSESTT